MDDKLVEFEANFSVLDRYGVDVTAETFITNPAIGRDNQLKELMLILLTPEKSAILIGKPGIGKTAIVEGLAYRMQKGEVPDALKGYTIINIKTASLLGTMPSGESKVQKMIDELKLREKIILFVDEIHMLIGATDSSSLDFANIFKEGLGRGSIKVIGATTTEEYERYILRDKAFTRRFQKVDVPEPTHDETVQIMMGTLPKFEKQTGRKMKYTSFIQQRIMNFLVEITSEYKRVFALGSRYPDVCLTLLKQAFSYTVFDNREYMDIFDIRKAIENSKNIYPDVIKKELPRFDKEFNDIILEEKGLKPVEEWRKDDTPIRSNLENNAQNIFINSNDNYTGRVNNSNGGNRNEQRASNIFMDSNNTSNRRENDFDFSNLESRPGIVDKKQIKEYQPVKSILSPRNSNRHARVGSTSLSKGIKEKFNQKKDSKQIDDLLLSGEIKVITSKEKEIPNIPFKYKITDELKPGGTNDFLLGNKIGSTLDEKKPKLIEVETYKSENSFERQPLGSSSSLMLNQRSENRQNNRGSFTDDRNLNNEKFRDYNFRSDKRNDNGMGNNVDDFLMRGRKVDGDKVSDNRNFNITESINNQQVIPRTDNFVSNHDFFGSQESKDNVSSNYRDNDGANKDTLFGAPMYSDDRNNANKDTLFGAPMYSDDRNNANKDTLFGAPMYSNDRNNANKDTLFGAPMYSNDIDNTKVVNETDIFGQLLVPENNMIIRDGKIVDNLSGLNVNNDSDSGSGNSSNQLMFGNNDYSQDNGYYNSNDNSAKKWKFLSDLEDKDTKPAKFNELKINNNNNDYEMERRNVSNNRNDNGGFINFSDLNAGRVSTAEVNKSISFSNTGLDNRDNNYNVNNNIDLNLESGGRDDRYFDDFFED